MLRTSLAWLTAALVGIGGCRGKCDLGDDLVDRSGGKARDCGRVPIGGATGTVDECAIGAFEAKQPFFARYDRQGFDSQVAVGVAFDGANMTFLFWDSSPGGSGYDYPVTDSQRCAQPRVDRAASQTRPSPPFTCATGAPLERTCE